MTTRAAVLYDIPVSNNGARCRIAIYAKGIEDKVLIKKPSELGGLKSDDYLALNPNGKMPLLITESGDPLYESEVILQYILDKYSDDGPSLIPSTPELRAHAALGSRVFDTYLQPHQGAMYRKMDIKERADKLAEIDKHLKELENLCMAPYFSGSTPSTSDCTLFPSFIFFHFMLEKKLGWQSAFYSKPKLEAWYKKLCGTDSAQQDDFVKVTKRVYSEVMSGLNAWDENDRWEVQGINEQMKNKEYKWAYP